MQINIEKKHLFGIVLFMLLVMGGIFIYANIPNPGHSASEIYLGEESLEEVISRLEISIGESGVGLGPINIVGDHRVDFARTVSNPSEKSMQIRIGTESDTEGHEFFRILRYGSNYDTYKGYSRLENYYEGDRNKGGWIDFRPDINRTNIYPPNKGLLNVYGQISAYNPSSSNHVATKGYVDTRALRCGFGNKCIAPGSSMDTGWVYSGQFHNYCRGYVRLSPNGERVEIAVRHKNDYGSTDFPGYKNSYEEFAAVGSNSGMCEVQLIGGNNLQLFFDPQSQFGSRSYIGTYRW